MEATHNRCTDGSSMSMTAAPFVLKTYGIVNDPSTDSMIAWGRCNNSFVVVDLFGFCMHLLPSHFKHSNFSSFVRQLNTYGFRKVDPDRWEFAHESFLCGQTHLLHLIVRRSGTGNNRGAQEGKLVVKEEDLEAEAEELERMVTEVEKLKQEQRATGEEMRRIWERIQETERKPRQMLAFLLKVVQNTQLLPRLSQTSIDVNGEEDDHRHRLRGEAIDYDDSRDKMKRPVIMFSSSSAAAAADPPPPALPHCASSPLGTLGREYLLDVPMESVMTPEGDHCPGGTDVLRPFPQYVSLNDVGDEGHHQPCSGTEGIVRSRFAGEDVADGDFQGEQRLLMPEFGWDGEIDSGAFPCPLSFSSGARF